MKVVLLAGGMGARISEEIDESAGYGGAIGTRYPFIAAVYVIERIWRR